MQLNKSFTLILLTKGRHNFTQRWLDYMKIIKFKYPIIIADGQDDDETKKMISKINQDQNLTIQYFRYNTHAGYHDYYKMKLDVLNKVKTDLVMLCDNDDFILPSGLNQQIDFLNTNTEFVSASGRIMNFEINNYDYATFGQNINFLNSCEYYRLEEPLSDWKDHINSVFTRFQPNFYNVFQTKFMKIIAKELVELNFTDLVINEFYIQLRAATLGKSKILGSSFHYLRQRGTSSISTGYNFSEDLLRKNMPADVRRLSTKISSVVCEQSNYSKDEIFLFMLKSFSNYLNFYLPRVTLKFRFPKVYKFKIKLLEFYRNNFKFLKKIIRSFKNKNNLTQILNLIEKKNQASLKEEIIHIQNFLTGR
jgi:glycosyltransferase domain-containing protein